MRMRYIALSGIWLFSAFHAIAEIRVPAHTAYLEPDVNGARISARSGITGWKDSSLRILWYGEIKTPGALDASVALRLPKEAKAYLRRIEELAGVPIDIVSTGPSRDAVIMRRHPFD